MRLMVKNFIFLPKTIGAIVACLLCFASNARCQFIIEGYYADPTVAGQYDIIGTGLSQVTNLTDSSYIPQGDSNTALSFSTVSDQELTFSLSGNLSTYVDLIFSDSTYTDVEVTLTNTGGRYNVPLTTVGAGQTLTGGNGSARTLILSGGAYGNGGGGSNVTFVENGGTFLGNGGGGSNTTYYEPGAYGTTNTGGGGGEIYKEVNSISVLSALAPGTVYSGSSSSTTPVTISGGSATVTGTNSLGFGLLSLAGSGTTTTIDYLGGTGSLSSSGIVIANGGIALIRNRGGGVLTLPGVNENGGTLRLSSGDFVVGAISGAEGSDPDINGATVGYTTTNTYNGPTSIENGGTLLTGVNGALPTPAPYTDLTLGSLSDTAGQTNTLDLLGTTQTVDSLTAAGPGTNQIISSNGTASGTPAIGTSASSSTGNLTVNTSGYTGGTDTFSGSLGGTGGLNNFSVTKSGTGTLALTGTNTYTGGTTVNGGTLLANSSNSTGSGAVSVASGGTLGGSGTINTSAVASGNAVTVASGGSLSPSAGSGGISTLTLALHAGSTVNLLSGAQFAFDLGASGLNDEVRITGGTLTLNTQNFSNFTFITVSGFTGTGTYNLFVMDAGGDITGSLGTATGTIVSGSNNYTGTLSVLGPDLQLSVAPASAPEPSSWAMLLGGLGLLAFWRTHRMG
jgi:MYXO-CTERM domain-containing protein